MGRRSGTPAYALLRLSIRDGYADVEDLKHAISEAARLDVLMAAAPKGQTPAEAAALARLADIPAIFRVGALSAMGGEHSLLMSERPSRVLFPLRSYFSPEDATTLTVDPNWRKAEQGRRDRAFAAAGGAGDRSSFMDSDSPELVLQLSLRKAPSSIEEQQRRCMLKSLERPRKERRGFRRYVSFRVHVVGTRGGMTPQWLCGYAAALGHALEGRRRLLQDGGLRYGEFVKPISIHIGFLTDEQACGAGKGFYAVLVSKKPSTIVKANQLPKPDASRPKLLPNGKRHYLPWPKELEQLSLLPAE